jgi:hypothetical protein
MWQNTLLLAATLHRGHVLQAGLKNRPIFQKNHRNLAGSDFKNC